MARETINKKVYLECECSDFDHTVRVSLWDWKDDPPEAFMEYRLNDHEGFWNRIKTAFNYVFGTDGATLVYHDVILSSESIDNLYSLCRDYKLARELYELGVRDDNSGKIGRAHV